MELFNTSGPDPSLQTPAGSRTGSFIISQQLGIHGLPQTWGWHLSPNQASFSDFKICPVRCISVNQVHEVGLTVSKESERINEQLTRMFLRGAPWILPRKTYVNCSPPGQLSWMYAHLSSLYLQIQVSFPEHHYWQVKTYRGIDRQIARYHLLKG